MFRMNTASLRATLQQLQQAQHDHLEWYENLIRTIVCRLPCDPRELADNAHHSCRFGQWYYAEASADLRQQKMFEAMEAEHARVHDIAGRLLRETMDGVPLVQAEFDELVAVINNALLGCGVPPPTPMPTKPERAVRARIALWNPR